MTGRHTAEQRARAALDFINETGQAYAHTKFSPSDNELAARTFVVTGARDVLALVAEQQCERQPVERLTWRDAKVGGRVAIRVYGPPDGWEDVYRTVIASDWPTIRLRDEQTGREYEIDASSEKEHRRSIRRVPSSLPARAALGDGEQQ